MYGGFPVWPLAPCFIHFRLFFFPCKPCLMGLLCTNGGWEWMGMDGIIIDSYTLVNIQRAIENGPFIACIVDLRINSMMIFNSYVCLPERIYY